MLNKVLFTGLFTWTAPCMLGTVRELEIVTNPYGPQSGEVILKLNEAPQGILIIQ